MTNEASGLCSRRIRMWMSARRLRKNYLETRMLKKAIFLPAQPRRAKTRLVPGQGRSERSRSRSRLSSTDSCNLSLGLSLSLSESWRIFSASG